MTLRALLGLLVVTASATAGDWPQWRGANRDGHSTDTGLTAAWPETGPKLRWMFREGGLGYSTPAVVGNMVYGFGADKDNDEFLFAVEAATGKQLWRTPTGAWFKNNWGGGPRGTPTVDGDAVYCLGAKGDLACVDAKTGALRWKKNLVSDLNGKNTFWGYSESVLVDGDQVICSPGGEDGTLAALDKKSGKVLWRSQGLTDDASYASVVVSEGAGVRHYVQLTAKGVAGVSPKDGALLWRVEGEGYRVAVIPTAVIHGDTVFATTDYGAKCMLIRLSRAGDGLKAEKLYSNKALDNHHGGVVRVGDYVFGSKGNANQQSRLPFVCLELKSGKPAWTADDKLEPSAVSYADGLLYCYGQETGTLVRVKAGPGGFAEVGRFTIPEESRFRQPAGRIWTHPVIANGHLFLRDQELLYCYDLAPGQAAD